MKDFFSNLPDNFNLAFLQLLGTILEWFLVAAFTVFGFLGLIISILKIQERIRLWGGK